jgi:hypothetical protein
VLDQPHVVWPNSPYLNASREIANKRFVLDTSQIAYSGLPTGNAGRMPGSDTQLSAFGLLTLPPGANGIRIVNCEFVGPWRSIARVPDRKPGSPRLLKGIAMYHATDIRIEACEFDYIPREAIYFYGCTGVEIEDVWSRNCTQLVRADWMGRPRSRHIRLNRLHHADGWGGANLAKDPEYASVYQRGRAVGTNAVSGYYADAEISNLTTSGEVKSGLKLVNPVRVSLDRVYSPRLMIQGTIGWNHTGDPREGEGKLGAYNPAGFDETLGDHAMEVTIGRSRFRPQENAWKHGDSGNTIQLSYHQERIRFRNCVIYRPGNPSNVGIHAWDGVEADVRACQFVGWPRPDDPLKPHPAQKIVRTGDYGEPGSLPASINADFVEVNEFEPG